MEDVTRRGWLRPGGPLRTSQGAAIAGIIFGVLLITALVLLRISVPAHPEMAGAWLADPRRRTAVAVALNLIPFAGIAFLWFIGVLRDRIGEREDRLFATVFLGSGLLLLRLSDAVAELGPTLGRQVHRSYWVARRAVSSVERDRYRVRLILRNGARVPVSRTFLPKLRAEGWL